MNDSSVAKHWDVERVCTWLTDIGLARFRDSFREERVTGEMLLSIVDEESAAEVVDQEHVSQLLEEIAKLATHQSGPRC